MEQQALLGLMFTVGNICIHPFLMAPLICSLALVPWKIATNFVDPEALQPLLNNRLISLDKNPGVCPKKGLESFISLIAKSILWIVKSDALEAAGFLQFCAGQRGGCEAAIHTMREIFIDNDTERVLLVDAFKCLHHL